MTKIEWTEKTWNPIVGCSIVSPGCTNCYAMGMAARIEAMFPEHDRKNDDSFHYVGSHYAGLTKKVNGRSVWTGKLAIAPPHIWDEPLRRRKPTMWFVNSMGDLFHEDVSEEWLRSVFAIMAQTPQHTYQVLTKRAERMQEVMSRWQRDGLTLRSGHGAVLPNVWLGVSAERQTEWNERVEHLGATPAAVRFVSAEPLLGPIDCGNSLYDESDDYRPVDWVIVGGESGPRARQMDPAWARSIRDQCQAADVKFFLKQMTKKGPIPSDLFVREMPARAA